MWLCESNRRNELNCLKPSEKINVKINIRIIESRQCSLEIEEEQVMLYFPVMKEFQRREG